MSNSMKGKICLVTGGTSGIGLETAKGLAEADAEVIITGRNEELGKKIVQDIKKITGNKFIELMIYDFAYQDQVRKLSEKIHERYDRLDVLINNAGLYSYNRAVTADGFELTFAVNYLAPFLLTNLLLDYLKKGAPSRIIIVSSSWHKSGKINFDDLNLTKKYNGMQAYRNAKLDLLLFTYYLAEKVKKFGITVNALHPGIVKTNLPRQKSFFSFLLHASPFFISAKKGAETSIYLATSPEVEHVTGEYFIKKKPAKSLEISYDLNYQKKLWEISEKLTRIRS